MFGDIGIEKLLLLFGVVLLLFGAKRLPQIGGSLGKGIQEFRRSITGASGAPSEEFEHEERSSVPRTLPDDPPVRDGAGDGPKRLMR